MVSKKKSPTGSAETRPKRTLPLPNRHSATYRSLRRHPAETSWPHGAANLTATGMR